MYIFTSNTIIIVIDIDSYFLYEFNIGQYLNGMTEFKHLLIDFFTNDSITHPSPNILLEATEYRVCMRNFLCLQLRKKAIDMDGTNGVARFEYTRLILGLRPANERRRYKVTSSLIGWAQT